MFVVRQLFVMSLLAALAAPLQADDAKKQVSGVTSPEHTVLLLLPPITESTVLGGAYHVSSADRPWWSGIWNLDIAKEDGARIREEFDAAPARVTTGLVYECQARWVVPNWHPYSRSLKITSSPKRLQVEGDSWRRARITGSSLRHQPGDWAGKVGDKSPYRFRSFLWLLENKDIKELASEQERLAAELKSAKVPSKESALLLAAKDSPVFARRPAEMVMLDRAVVDQPGFKRGDLFWAISSPATSPDGKVSGSLETFINAQSAVAVSNTNTKPRSLTKYLLDSPERVEPPDESTGSVGNKSQTKVVALVAAQPPGAEHKLRLPKIERDYAMIGATGKSGKTLAELIPPKTISRIALTHDHGIGDLEKRQGADADALLVRLFESPAKAEQWGLSATERSAAEFMVVTKGGDLYRLSIVQDLFGNRLTACLLYAKGYSCRFAIDPSVPGNKKEK